MAKWGKGESGNPSGRPKLPEEAKELRKLTAEQITTVFSKYLGMTMSEMSAVRREELSLLELWIIKAAEKERIEKEKAKLEVKFEEKQARLEVRRGEGKDSGSRDESLSWTI
jgi:BMFP domain-containing protein YqiC